MRPNFPNAGNPLTFWTEVCQQIQHGVIQGGFEALVQAAARNYPGNPVFNSVSGGVASSAAANANAPASGSPTSNTGSVASISGTASSAPGGPVSPSDLKIFLCHSSGDKQPVRDVYAKLKNDGFTPWLDEEDLLPGQNWNLEIRKAVRDTDIVLVFLSNDSVSKRGYVQKEIKMALDVADEQLEGDIFIIPLKLEPCDIPDRLSHCHWVDYYPDTNRDAAYERLKRALLARANEI